MSVIVARYNKSQGGGILSIIDLSDQVTGATNIFVLPNSRAVSWLDYTSAPFHLRVNNDFTQVGNVITITYKNDDGSQWYPQLNQYIRAMP